jgi:hypothetical protein
MSMDSDFVLQRLRQLAPFESAEQAERIFEAALSALAAVLNDDEAADLELELGAHWSPALRRTRRVQSSTLEAFYRQVVLYTGVRRAIAEELAQVCCRVLAAGLPAASVRRIQVALPEVAPLFDSIERGSPPDGPYQLRHDPMPDYSIAGGRPGASRPLATARPIAVAEALEGATRLTHSNSVVSAQEPHSDTKLSSARGLTQEREHRSLATAKPRRDDPER